jgi:hypothetical protein
MQMRMWAWLVRNVHEGGSGGAARAGPPFGAADGSGLFMPRMIHDILDVSPVSCV